MQLLFLGSGSAFTVGDDNYHCNIVVTKTHFADPQCKRLLLDCGSDIRFSLHDAGLVPCQISDIYISHLHFDYIVTGKQIGRASCRERVCQYV